MSRRDTIIIAVIINAGLMVMLFVSALKKDPKDTVVAKADKSHVVPQVVKQAPAKPVIKMEAKVKKEIAHQKVVKPVLPQEKKLVEKPKQTVERPAISRHEFVAHTVRKGDVLEKIARHYKSSVEDIKKANQLSSTTLQIGQKLLIPSSGKKVSSQPELRKSSANDFYVVKNGDNLWKIAMENKLKVEDLLKLNNLNEKKAKALRPGDKLRIR